MIHNKTIIRNSIDAVKILRGDKVETIPIKSEEYNDDVLPQ